MKYINKEDLLEKSFDVQKSDINLDGYDMYYVYFKMKDETIRTIRVFSDKGKAPNIQGERVNIEDVSMFFGERLLGREGLMAKEGRDDYIYLGSYYPEYTSNSIADRSIVQEDGKTGQENFDRKLFRIKTRVEAHERTKQLQSKKTNINNGKHYVISDIHGMYGSYHEAMKRLTPKDHLYILGDVLDRGNGGIKIIKDIIKRQSIPANNPQITFLMGNHEMQFLTTISIMMKYKLSPTDISYICDERTLTTRINYDTAIAHRMNKEELKNCRKELSKCKKAVANIMRTRRLSEAELEMIYTYSISNRGFGTIYDYARCNFEEQKEIYNFLYDSYVTLPLEINGRDYLLAHSMPPESLTRIKEMKKTGKGYWYKDLTVEETNFIIEERGDGTYNQARNQGFTTICGHTPEMGRIVRDKQSGFIRIDAGCGHRKKNSKLALYCIEDDEVAYINERETEQDVPEL